MKRTRVRLALPVAAALTTFAISTSAWAHVTVTATDATPGASDVEITFRVPNELPSARVVRVDVTFPVDTPIADVLIQPVAGWAFTEKTSKLATPVVTDDGNVTEAVSEVDWRATGSGITPGEFEAFTVIAGQLPEAKSLTFKAIQTYSNGTTVSWIEVPAPGDTAEPEHPAPVLVLSTRDHRTPAAGSADTGLSNALSVAALVVAVLGGLATVVVYRSTRGGS